MPVLLRPILSLEHVRDLHLLPQDVHGSWASSGEGAVWCDNAHVQTLQGSCLPTRIYLFFLINFARNQTTFEHFV